MCGIIGASLRTEVAGALIEGLERMEYRGYDSAGLCVQKKRGFACLKAAGKLEALKTRLIQTPLSGTTGIGHTRWATHGAPDETNAHPHLGRHAAIVHNGIIENHAALRDRLTRAGARFVSETDTEVIPHLIDEKLRHCSGPEEAWREMLLELQGAYALAGMLDAACGRVWFARRGSPLLLGRSSEGYFVASDALALAGLACEIAYLEEGDWGWIERDSACLRNANGKTRSIDWRPMPAAVADHGKGRFRHYMEKEIHEQPEVLARILQAYAGADGIRFPEAPMLENGMPERIVMVACGTSYHAALTARYWLERHLQIPVEVDIASEYRYRDPVIGSGSWMITLSQSGETADTLEALRMFKARTPDNPALAICNVPTSSLARESDGLIELLAGPEIGVASTKAYLAQLAVLALLSLRLAERAGSIPGDGVRRHLAGLREVPAGIERLLGQRQEVAGCVPLFAGAHGALFLGRGPCYPLALEGALKLKEISYLHAEGYAAGEMKHGPIALIDSRLPVVVVAPRAFHLDKVLSNLHEVRARGARVILVTDLDADGAPQDVDRVLHIPEGDEFGAPLYAAVPLQLLAYEVALARGTDVDQPRNLAKSVTVE